MSMDVNADITKAIRDSKKSKIWCVAFWNNGEEPIVSLFNNEESARDCYTYFKLLYDGCCIDKCDVFSKFSLT